MITTAVILAAGKGSRLGHLNDNMPKGFIEVDNKPIVEQSIHKLIACGIEKIIIGTGYKSEYYDSLADRYPLVKCIKNSMFTKFGSMRTLSTTSEMICDDFLLLESDLLYDISALKLLLNSTHNNCILASDPSGSLDEVFIETDGNQKLLRLSKVRQDLNRIDGEFIGISRVSRKCLTLLCEYENKYLKKNSLLDYEYAITGISDSIKFEVEKIADLVWCEIDTSDHLNRAIKTIYPMIRSSEKRWNVRRNILLNPGPVTTTDSVKYAQVKPDICPREIQFGQLLMWICRKLSAIADPSDSCVTTLFGGSGTAAMESIISSVIEKGHLLIVNNGAYGQRIVEIASTYNINYTEFASDPFSSVSLEKISSCIVNTNKMNPITHLAVVHHETTTGVLNNIGAIGKICAENNIEMLVDAISSYAAIPIDMVKMNISHLASTSNKNLQGTAGIGFVISQKESIKKLKDIKSRSYYLDLFEQYRYLNLYNQTRFTPPVQTLFALRQAILETISEGVSNRYHRYTQSWKILLSGLNRLGLQYPVPIQDQSHLLTSIYDPDDPQYNFDQMHDFLLNNGFTIYPGKVPNVNTFRVANIGDVTSDEMTRFVDILERYLNTLTIFLLKRNPQWV